MREPCWDEPSTLRVAIGTPSGTTPAGVTEWFADGDQVYVTVEQEGQPKFRALLLSSVAELFGGLPADVTCDMTSDVSSMLRAPFTLVLSYLSTAAPGGPQSVADAAPMRKRFTIAAGRLNITPGDFMERNSASTIDSLLERETPNRVRFEFSESVAEAAGDVTVTYSGSWSGELEGSFPRDDEPLNSWLVCMWPGVSRKAAITVGQLRGLRSEF